MTVTGTRATAADYDATSPRSRSASSRCATARRSTRSRLRSASLDVLVNNAGANFPDGRDEWDPDGFAARSP